MTSAPGAAVLNDQQERIVNHLLENPVTAVSAGAGSGKTRTLIAGVVALVEGGHAQVNNFALITFTTKAADELRTRLHEALDERAGTGADGQRWALQVERLSATFVGTIHSFCHEILRVHGGATHVPRSATVSMSGYLLHESLRTSSSARSTAARRRPSWSSPILLSPTTNYASSCNASYRTAAARLSPPRRGPGIRSEADRGSRKVLPLGARATPRPGLRGARPAQDRPRRPGRRRPASCDRRSSRRCNQVRRYLQGSARATRSCSSTSSRTLVGNGPILTP